MLALLLQAALQSPLSPEDERATFVLPAGFSAELVVAEPDVKKIVDIAFDDAGRMWAITASEYPLDGNESSAAAELYAKGGADEVLVFDTPTAAGRQRPRVFAGGLAMPMALLPWKSGALVGHGPEILWLDDRNGDGRADAREVVLSGFGIEDSHLMPHRFVRTPGDWILVAQGAFNYSKVLTKRGASVTFEQCKLARFQPDGSAFEVIGYGLNNIWGIVLDRSGEVWIQEANDQGFPVVPFFRDASYPGIGDHKHRPYSPWQPALAAFEMGGTGLSGLARAEDRGGFPEPFASCFFVANPILNAVQTIAVTRAGDVDRLERHGDLLTSADEWFRPVAIHFGPDGCLYVVDWYNAIISHNEVSRTDARRDKARSRIWRIRHTAMARRVPPDMTRVPTAELVTHLDADSTWEARAAWHQIVDRGTRELASELRTLLVDPGARSEARILALWSLEGLALLDRDSLAELVSSPPALRREAVRASAALPALDVGLTLRLGAPTGSHDVRTTVELIHCLTAAWVERADEAALRALLELAPAPPPLASSIDEPRERYVEFERSLIRAAFEDGSPARGLALAERTAPDAAEGRILFALALGGAGGARLAAAELARQKRGSTGEELALLAAHLDLPEARAAIEQLLGDRAQCERVVDALLERDIDVGALAPLLSTALAASPAEDATPARKDRMIHAASAWKLAALAPTLAALVADSHEPSARRARALDALVELGAQQAEPCAELARSALPGEELQRSAVLALAALRNDAAAQRLFELWRSLGPVLRRSALAELSASADGARALLAALERDDLDPRDLDAALLARLSTVGAGSQVLARLEQELARRAVPTLACFGGNDDGLDTDLELAPPFTLEAWVKLAEPITNADGILGRAGDADFNFADGRFRFYAGPGRGDRVIARRALEPEVWTHVAVTCDAHGAVVLYQNAEAEAEGTCEPDARFTGLDVARTTPGEGTRGRIAELRVWRRARSAQEIGADHRRRTEALEDRAGLVRAFSTAADFVPLAGAAQVEGAFDGPPVLDARAAQELEQRFSRARLLAGRGGDAARGRESFARNCGVCHALGGEGGQIGPPLDGSAHRGTEALLRAIVTPGAAVESGYRLLRVETVDGERLDGFLASQDERTLVLRRQGREDLRLERSAIAALAFDTLSVMPDGLLDGLGDDEVADLFAYLATLR